VKRIIERAVSVRQLSFSTEVYHHRVVFTTSIILAFFFRLVALFRFRLRHISPFDIQDRRFIS